MNEITIEAVYENGILKLPRQLPLAEGQKVNITVRVLATATPRLAGQFSWNLSKDDEEYLLGPDNHPWSRDG